MKLLVLLFLHMVLSVTTLAQNINRVKEPDILRQRYRREILIPDVNGFTILKCDFHMHTVFSDGDVWPSVRVQEAYYEGLDAMAITEHIEYLPLNKFVTGDHNSAYEIALPEAEKLNILLVKGAEITRPMPPGHFIALFLTDANKLETDSYMDAIEEVHRQGGFLLWAHPGWDAQQPDTTRWWDVHEQIFQRGWLQGIEVYNWDEWYPIAFDWCNEKNLAYIGNSDAHTVASYEFKLDKYFRPMTLVFARDRSIEGLREAMFARRTVAFFVNRMAGPEDLLRKLFDSAVIVEKPFRTDNDGISSFVLKNPTDLTFIFENPEPANDAPARITLKPRSSVIVNVKLENGKANLPYHITNMHIRSNQVLEITLRLGQ